MKAGISLVMGQMGFAADVLDKRTGEFVQEISWRRGAEGGWVECVRYYRKVY